MSDVLAVQEAVRAAARRLAEAGFADPRAGGVSARVGRRVVVAPTGAEKLAAADLPVVDLESGRGAEPGSELELHLAIHRRRPEIGAIIRPGSPHAMTMSEARRELPPVLEELAQIAGPSVRVVDPADPAAPGLARRTLAALRWRRAALLAHRGAVCLGRSLDEAWLCCVVLERSCRAFIEAQFLGGATHLSPLEAHVFHQYFLRRYSKGWKRARAPGEAA